MADVRPGVGLSDEVAAGAERLAEEIALVVWAANRVLTTGTWGRRLAGSGPTLFRKGIWTTGQRPRRPALPRRIRTVSPVASSTPSLSVTA